MTDEYWEAYKALYAHVWECPDCPENCAEGAALRKALREAP
ncbi:putative protein OS=Streptomyces aurantiogriseus OX=66870 GN=GCM10010251_45540 PE=4 SV=1 [Streptomyces aurantiogriseus]|uniref:Uncharacterized protein n=1 Tax=Streptomyces aurantiogriseus TaxID=66870 RepID=A0A918CIB6_9ACTN|nr:hypothetical protein GCM10010251_45540 [Streptomyces aurantiogriseus]